MNNKPVCIIDILENACWMKNDISADEKFFFLPLLLPFY